LQWQTEEMAKCVFSWPAHLKVAKFSKIDHEMANPATLGNTGISDPKLLGKPRGSRSRPAPLFRHKG